MNVCFINSTHGIGYESRRAGKVTEKPINIGDGCWIGANSIIMPGVNIESGVVIGAGSLVLSDCISNSVYLGSPARLYKTLD